MHIYPFTYPSIDPSIYPSVHLSFHLYPFIHPLIYSSIYPSTRPCIDESGPVVASKSSEVRYQEICRDPPEVDRDFSFSFRVDELKPGVSYRFRIRAFNAFGAGELRLVMTMMNDGE